MTGTRLPSTSRNEPSGLRWYISAPVTGSRLCTGVVIGTSIGVMPSVWNTACVTVCTVLEAPRSMLTSVTPVPVRSPTSTVSAPSRVSSARFSKPVRTKSAESMPSSTPKFDCVTVTGPPGKPTPLEGAGSVKVVETTASSMACNEIISPVRAVVAR